MTLFSYCSGPERGTGSGGGTEIVPGLWAAEQHKTPDTQQRPGEESRSGTGAGQRRVAGREANRIPLSGTSDERVRLFTYDSKP